VSARGVGSEERGFDSIETFRDRLCELFQKDGRDGGGERSVRAQKEAECAIAAARQAEILTEHSDTWREFLRTPKRGEGFVCGTEHGVDYDPDSQLVVKITKPPGFGLFPRVVSVPRYKGGEVGWKREPSVEFVAATPIEYLERWIRANEVFDDDTRLVSVVRWRDGQVSFCIVQPHYDGEAATERQIESSFIEGGWTPLRDPRGEHLVYMNYPWNVLAVDALPRNCKYNKDGLQPFDVILVTPDDDLDAYFKIY